MSESRTQSLLRRMADEQPPAPSAGDRERAVARMEKTLRAMARERDRARTRRILLAGLALAAVVLLSLGAFWKKPWQKEAATTAPTIRLAAVDGEVFVTHGGATASASDGNLAADDRVITSPGGRARLVFPSGATIEIGPATEITPHVDRGERAFLDAGSIQVHVPKLGDRGSFAIDTPNAVVTVHGTTFEVDVRAVDPRTHVHVTEGRVSVVSPPDDVLLEAGQSWPAPTATTVPIVPSPLPTIDPIAITPLPSAKPRRSPVPSATPQSALADQNRLLQSALAARREGRDADSLTRLEELLVTYPNSTLAQEARVEHFRTLERLGRHADAVADARRYLAAYPDGFARDEARTLIAK